MAADIGLNGSMIVDTTKGSLVSYDEAFASNFLNNFNVFTKNTEVPETNTESAQVKSYLQMLCDKVMNLLGDAQVYQRKAGGIEGASLVSIKVKLTAV